MTVLTFKYPKALKAHKCRVCGCDIPKGSVHHYQTGVYDGSFQSWRAHSDCAEMHWHHNRGRMEDDQADDYLRCGYRGRWPHAINRLELRQELSQRTRSPLTAAKKVTD